MSKPDKRSASGVPDKPTASGVPDKPTERCACGHEWTRHYEQQGCMVRVGPRTLCPCEKPPAPVAERCGTCDGTRVTDLVVEYIDGWPRKEPGECPDCKLTPAPVADGLTLVKDALRGRIKTPLADGGEIRCKECGGNGYLYDVAALRAENTELRRQLEELAKRLLVHPEPRADAAERELAQALEREEEKP